jgi:ribosomal protein S18 acetylase RimI-like enzyme
VDLITRQALPADYKALLPLFNQMDALHRENHPEMFKKPERKPREKQYYLDLLSKDEVGFFLAQNNDRVIGFVHVEMRDTPSIEVLVQRRYAVIDGIVVDNQHQGAGVGRELMEAAQNWALLQGAESVELNVYKFNKEAIAFYKTLGYETIFIRMRMPISNE